MTYTFDKAGQLGSCLDWSRWSVAHSYWPDGLVRTAANAGGSATSYVPPATPEPDVAALDRVEQHRPIDALRGHDGECGVTLELGQPERRLERRYDGPDQIRKDVLGVVELDIGEVAGVPGDVGDEESGGLGGREHPPVVV